MSLHETEDVDPAERSASYVHDPELRGNQKEVYRLSRKPESARPLERRKEFVLALFERSLLHLHQRHSGEKNHQQRRRQNKLIKKQFPQNYFLGGARECSIEPFVPVV